MQNIAVLFGGRVAEGIVHEHMTTGASNDFQRATASARDMVTDWGMSEALGPMVYGENEGEVFLGRSMTTHKNMSEATMQKVDAEIRRIMDQQYALAKKDPDRREPRQGRGDDQPPCWNGKPSMPSRSATSWQGCRRAHPSRPLPQPASSGGDKPSAPAPTTQPAQET